MSLSRRRTRVLAAMLALIFTLVALVGVWSWIGGAAQRAETASAAGTDGRGVDNHGATDARRVHVDASPAPDARAESAERTEESEATDPRRHPKLPEAGHGLGPVFVVHVTDANGVAVAGARVDGHSGRFGRGVHAPTDADGDAHVLGWLSEFVRASKDDLAGFTIISERPAHDSVITVRLEAARRICGVVLDRSQRRAPGARVVLVATPTRSPRTTWRPPPTPTDVSNSTQCPCVCSTSARGSPCATTRPHRPDACWRPARPTSR
jgi:hypothetical protein